MSRQRFGFARLPPPERCWCGGTLPPPSHWNGEWSTTCLACGTYVRWAHAKRASGRLVPAWIREHQLPLWDAWLEGQRIAQLHPA